VGVGGASWHNQNCRVSQQIIQNPAARGEKNSLYSTQNQCDAYCSGQTKYLTVTSKNIASRQIEWVPALHPIIVANEIYWVDHVHTISTYTEDDNRLIFEAGQQL
jgi:hypothetical protein